MRLLITGICGFVGSTLAQSWLEAQEGLEIIGLDNLSRAGSETNLPLLRRLGINVRHGDLRQASDLATLPAVDWVVDAAANPSVLAGVEGASSRRLVEHNLSGTINLLEYCREHRAGMILLSTSRVYSITALAQLPVTPVADAFNLCPRPSFPDGVSTRGIAEAFSTRPPLSLYGSTKLCSEIMTLEYGAIFDFPVWINRCGVLAGAGQFGRPDQGIFAYWINAWLRRRALTYKGFGGHGFQVRDCLHPRDLVSLLARQTASCAAPERIFNLGGGPERAISLAQLSSWCGARFGSRPVAEDPRQHPYDVPWVVLDSTRAAAAWGWQPQTPLEVILEEIAGHAEEHPDWLERSGAA